ncbi:MAG: ATP-dependent DNA helicase UvrD2 [Acidimicrobiales bacterium]
MAEVRACALDHPDAAVGGDAAPPIDSGEAASAPTDGDRPTAPRPSARGATTAPGRRRAGPTALDVSPEAVAGPPVLGRSLLLAPGTEVPGPWRHAPTIAASAGADDATIERLHRAWRQRERLVIEWSGPLPPDEPVVDEEFHRLGPGTELPGERLRFAVTANTVHLKPDGVVGFAPLADALALGATPAGDGGADGGGDIVTAAGEPAWADGGPFDVFDASDLGPVTVVPRVHLAAGLAVAVPNLRSWPRAELASDQLDAVAHRGGPARIIAPAGSGKTRVLTERTRHLVRDRGLRPAAVSLVAYNRRARQEMADRLGDVPGLDIRTLNSLALAIATGTGAFATGERRPLATIGEMDARRLLDRIVPGRRRRQLTDPLEPWIDALSACRLGLRDPEEVEAAYGADVAGFADVVTSYRRELARRGQLDFDEQILVAVERLLRDPQARAVARSAAPLLLIDEFQDLTPAHLLLVRLLAGPAAEVFAVGDDDQTIYGYSGASPDWLVSFARFFPGAADHPLTVNYRCPEPVVAAVTNLLTHNRNRVPKTIHAGAADDGRPPTAPDEPGMTPGLEVATDPDPQRRLADHVVALLEAGAAPDDVAVLARVHAALLPALLHLREAGVPVARPPGVDTHLLERSGVAAALAWLRLATAPAQRLRPDDIRLALRRPPRSLHPRVADWVCEQRSVADLVALAGRLNREREATTVAELAADLERLRQRADDGAGAGELLDVVYHEIGLLGAASQLDQSQRTARRAAHADDLAALRAVADLGPGPDGLERWIRVHLEAAPAVSDTDQPPAVTLATVHTTKGLEWPHVVVHDVRGDLFPHRLATDTEEERRIFHVAITRARRSVLVNCSAPTSPFVAELASPRPADDPWPEPSAVVRSSSAPRAKATRPQPGSASEAAIRAALGEWRTTRCRADGVPAYIVLDNATLDAVAAAAPDSLVALGRVKGIGPAKLDRYGDDILGVVADATA